MCPGLELREVDLTLLHSLAFGSARMTDDASG
jgi:hypothetical protein